MFENTRHPAAFCAIHALELDAQLSALDMRCSHVRCGPCRNENDRNESVTLAGRRPQRTSSDGMFYFFPGCALQGFQFIRALEFAIAAMSTAGLQAPQHNDVSYVFTGLFVMVGVPVFGMTVATVAGAMAEQAVMDEIDEKMRGEINEAEYEFIDKLGDQDGMMDFTEFLIMSLLRIGVVDMNLMTAIKALFEFVDVDGSKAVSLSEARPTLAPPGPGHDAPTRAHTVRCLCRSTACGFGISACARRATAADATAADALPLWSVHGV